MQHLHTGYCKDTELATDAFKSSQTRPLPAAPLGPELRVMNPKKRRWEKRCQQLLASLERKEERKEQKKKRKKKRKKKENKTPNCPKANNACAFPMERGWFFVLWFLTEGKVGRARHGSDATLSRFCGPYGGRRGRDAAPSPTTQRK